MSAEQATAAGGPTIWLYRRGGEWSQIPDFLSLPDNPNADLAVEMKAAGFDPYELTYGDHLVFMVEVYCASSRPPRSGYGYFVWLSLGSHCEAVAVPTLPDLLALLGEVVPLSRSSAAAYIPAPPGWTASGSPIAAFAIDDEGHASPLVEPPPRHDGKPDTRGFLAHGFGRIQGPRR